MKLMTRLKNGSFSLNEAMKLSLDIISELLKTGIVVEIGLGPNKLISPSELSLDYLSSYFYERHREKTVDDIALLESKFGFHLPLYINLFSGVKAKLSLRLGTPQISGNDNILLQIHHEYPIENFQKLMPIIETFALFLIEELDPIEVICNNFEFVNLFSEKDLAYDLGFITYFNNQVLNQKEWTKMISFQEHKNGQLWKSTFLSYQDALNEVKELYQLI